MLLKYPHIPCYTVTERVDVTDTTVVSLISDTVDTTVPILPAMGKMWNCGMWKVKCGMENAERR